MATINITVASILASVNTLASCTEAVCFVSLDNTEDFAEFNEILAKSGIMPYVSQTPRFDGPNRGFEYYVTNTQQSQISKKLVDSEIVMGGSVPLHTFLTHLDSDVVCAAIARERASRPLVERWDAWINNLPSDYRKNNATVIFDFDPMVFSEIDEKGEVRTHGVVTKFLREMMAQAHVAQMIAHGLQRQYLLAGYDTGKVVSMQHKPFTFDPNNKVKDTKKTRAKKN